MPHAHDLAVGGNRGDLQLLRQGLALNGQGVVAGEARGARQAAEKAAAVQGHFLRLAVDDPPRGDDAAAERVADGLVAQADAEDGNRAGKPLDALHADARFFRPARPGRDDDARRVHGSQLVHGDPVVAENLDRLVRELGEVLVEVVREGIVVVDDDVHGYTSLYPMARASAPSFASVSSNSFSGTES